MIRVSCLEIPAPYLYTHTYLYCPVLSILCVFSETCEHNKIINNNTTEVIILARNPLTYCDANLKKALSMYFFCVLSGCTFMLIILIRQVEIIITFLIENICETTYSISNQCNTLCLGVFEKIYTEVIYFVSSYTHLMNCHHVKYEIKATYYL